MLLGLYVYYFAFVLICGVYYAWGGWRVGHWALQCISAISRIVAVLFCFVMGLACRNAYVSSDPG